ncbi:Hypothetical protein c4115 [Escherichia coli CFT073]|uniref:Uncharacterized protein n=1 Tax=Escherichia coli O6:H1 (strain CFT073 / ATCC 700928 / UPEC) TaxID=199310 RepID=A0A0H2VE24_ECOL6|nr:Hypothetical protein c4115 [Escherichia coli CFT073]EEJ49821.1 hypothetical protein HMPREF0358_0068 [Escherichia coli 83972]
MLIQDCPKLYEFSLTFKLKRLALLNGEPLSLRTLHAILGTSLLTVFNAGAVKRTTYGVVTNTREVFNTTTTDQDHGVLLQVVTFTTDVGSHFETVSQTNTAYFTQRGVRFFRSGSIYTSTYATFLRACFQRRHVAFRNFASTWFAYQLVNCCH